MGFYIPQTLKNIDNWVVWRKELGKKIPYDPRTNRKANPTKPCSSYEEALAYLEYGGEYEGLGFTFTSDCNLTFIDLDNCIDAEGNESELAQELQELFADTYIELSQSEKGLHIVCIGTVPSTVKTKEIEIYSCGRYMAMTGNSTNAKEPQEAQERLDLIFNRFKAEKAENKPQNAPQGYVYKCSQDAQTIIEAIKRSRQGEKWTRLHEGYIADYPSRSEAVLAYIAITNHFASGNDEITKEIFAQSSFPVDDPKYKQGYYIDRAIKKAKESATGNMRNRKRTAIKVVEVFEEQKKGRRRAK